MKNKYQPLTFLGGVIYNIEKDIPNSHSKLTKFQKNILRGSLRVFGDGSEQIKDLSELDILHGHTNSWIIKENNNLFGKSLSNTSLNNMRKLMSKKFKWEINQ